MPDCIFCKIANGEIPSTKVYEDDLCYAFKDLAPVAPTHFLIIPKVHLASIEEVNAQNSCVIAHIFEVIAELSKSMGMGSGFRVVSNCGPDAGQTIFHMHFHVLAGQKMGEFN